MNPLNFQNANHNFMTKTKHYIKEQMYRNLKFLNCINILILLILKNGKFALADKMQNPSLYLNFFFHLGFLFLFYIGI